MREDVSEAFWLSLNVSLQKKKCEISFFGFDNEVYFHKKLLYFCEVKIGRAYHFTVHLG